VLPYKFRVIKFIKEKIDIFSVVFKSCVMRNGGIDASRLICAFGIAWFHSDAPGARVAYLALPFFPVLLAMPSGAGMAQRATRNSLASPLGGLVGDICSGEHRDGVAKRS
jgi:hypothetical protein